MEAVKGYLPDDNLPSPMSCSLTDTPRQILSELELARVDARCGSAMKCGTVNTMDPMPITMEPGKTILV
jgi:hypothetical protein